MVDKGHFILHSYAEPPIPAGRYQLHVTQPGSGFTVEDHDAEVYLSSPRFVMPPDQILSTYPPAMSEGDFGGRLPQIVLKRRTLPWERNPDPATNPDPPTPWLALVVIAEGEGSISPAPEEIAKCRTVGATPLPDPTDIDSATGYSLSVTETVVAKIFPTLKDLPLLVHVREVDVHDTELAGGDDDGWMAVVLANRLPIAIAEPDGQGGLTTKPVKYMACLVNLEGQLGALPTTQVTDDDLTMVAAVQDLRLYADVAAHTDHLAMGSGVAYLAGGVQPLAANQFSAASHEFNDSLLAARPATSEKSSTWGGVADSSRFLVEDASASVRQQMVSGFGLTFDRYVLEKTYRFPVLAHWTFTSVNTGDFRSLMQGLDDGLIGTQYGTVLDSSGEHSNIPDPAAPPTAPPPTVAETGHIALAQITRRGEAATAWFRGPLSPHPTVRDPETMPPAHMSDELRTITPDGREDVSLASAFEIGRLLALSQPSLVNALTRWRREQFGAARAAAVGQLVAKGSAFASDELGYSNLGRLLGLAMIKQAGDAPAKTVGPSRPLTDPGRALELTGSLERTIADGLGLDLDRLAELGKSRGFAHAFATTEPQVQVQERFDDQSLSGLRGALDAELGRIANTAQPKLRIQSGPLGESGTPARDALDELLDDLDDDAFDTTEDRS